jgi:hypothetical protein
LPFSSTTRPPNIADFAIVCSFIGGDWGLETGD